MTVGTKLEVIKTKFSEMERVDASMPMEVVGLSNGKNARTTVQSIISKVTKETIGLDKVQNLAPNELPISDATKAELDKKVNRGDIGIADVNGLQSALDNKLAKDGVIEIPQVNGLAAELENLKPTVVQGSTDW